VEKQSVVLLKSLMDWLLLYSWVFLQSTSRNLAQKSFYMLGLTEDFKNN